jgi:hypothetical protein
MSLFDKLQPITAARQKLADRGITSNVVMDKVLSSTEAIINGRRMILLMRIVSPPHHRRPKDLAPEPPAPGWPTAPIPVMSS